MLLFGIVGECNILNYLVNVGYDDSNVSGSLNNWGVNV